MDSLAFTLPLLIVLLPLSLVCAVTGVLLSARRQAMLPDARSRHFTWRDRGHIFARQRGECVNDCPGFRGGQCDGAGDHPQAGAMDKCQPGRRLRRYLSNHAEFGVGFNGGDWTGSNRI